MSIFMLFTGSIKCYFMIVNVNIKCYLIKIMFILIKYKIECQKVQMSTTPKAKVVQIFICSLFGIKSSHFRTVIASLSLLGSNILNSMFLLC